MNKLRVMIVDDDVLVRAALRHILKTYPDLDVMDETDDGTRVLAMLAISPPDVLLLDVHMSSLSGVSLATTVRRRYPTMRIILMSSFHGADFEDHARQAGANGFIAKTDSPDVIVRALLGERREPGRKPPRPLSEHEERIAALAAQGYTNDQIAESLHLSINTVKTYVSRIFKKIGVRNRVELANRINRPT